MAEHPPEQGHAHDSHQDHHSRAAIAGHPIHPMIIPFPIALLGLLPITDSVYLVLANEFWLSVSYWLLLVGVITGALAAIFGAIDFLTIPPARTHRVGWLHLGANVAALALAVANLLLRDPPSDYADAMATLAPSAAILSWVTLLLLIFGGWYGGELVYRHRIGVTSATSKH